MLFDSQRDALVTGYTSLKAWPLCEAGSVAATGHAARITAVAHNALFQLVVSGDVAGTVCVWTLSSGRLHFRFERAHGAGAGITALTFDTEGRRLLTGGTNGAVSSWNLHSGACLTTMTASGCRSDITGVVCAKGALNHYVIATGWARRLLYFEDLRSERHVPCSKRAPAGRDAHRADVLAMALMEQSTNLVTVDASGEAKVSRHEDWPRGAREPSEAPRGIVRSIIDRPPARVTRRKARSPARSRALSKTWTALRQVWSFESGVLRGAIELQGVQQQPAHQRAQQALVFMKGGGLRHICALGGADGRIRFCDVKACSMLFELAAGAPRTWATRFLHQPVLAAEHLCLLHVRSWTRRVLASARRMLLSRDAHWHAVAPGGAITALGVSPSGDRLAAGTEGGNISVWWMSRLEQAVVSKTLPRCAAWSVSEEPVAALAFVDASLLVSATASMLTMWTARGVRVGVCGQSVRGLVQCSLVRRRERRVQ